MWEVPHNWASKLNKATCNEVSVFSIDESGAMIGEVNTDGSEFYGLTIQKGTLFAEAFEAKPNEDAFTLVTYQISRDAQEGCFLTIDSSEIEADMKVARSLIEVDLTQGTGPNTNTDIFINAFNQTLGTFNNFYALQGATDTADWKVYTSAGTSGTEITVTGVEEVSKGRYKISLAPDAATTVFVSFAKVKTTLNGLGFVADQLQVTKP